jgi:PUA domain protein
MLMPTKQRRYPLKAKEAKQIIEETRQNFGVNLEQFLDGKAAVEVVESDAGLIYLIAGKPLLFKSADKLLPTLLFSDFAAKAPRVVVDMGAVPYVCKGATVMAPGIVRVSGEFAAGDLVLVADVKFGKALAVAEALMDSAMARATKKGPVVKTLHYVGDKVWECIKPLGE